MGIYCDFCGNLITPMIGKFRHKVSSANFMIGPLSNKDEMCDVCYTKAKNNPPTKEEFEAENLRRKEKADKMTEDLMKF